MAVTASADALTSVANARLYANKQDQGNAPAVTDRLQIYVNAYSRAIHRYTGRQFLPAQVGVAKRFRYDGSGYLSLAPSEATLVSAVLLGSDLPVASQRLLAVQSATVESEFRLEPRNGTPLGTYLWLALPELGQFSPLVPEPTVTRRIRGLELTVTGNWGAGSVPADVELACLISVANAMRNPEGFASRSLGGMSFSEGAEVLVGDDSGLSLPRDARALLAPYRRTLYS